jgi:hypothetical protein
MTVASCYFDLLIERLNQVWATQAQALRHRNETKTGKFALNIPVISS